MFLRGQAPKGQWAQEHLCGRGRMCSVTQRKERGSVHLGANLRVFMGEVS